MLALIDYGSGNLRSAEKALVAAGAKEVRVTTDPDAIAQASQIVLPGVGAFADCARNLAAVDGLRDVLEVRVRGAGVPFLGICVGMQLLAERGVEFETAEGLGWIPGQTSALEPGDLSLKVPHMGWNKAVPNLAPDSAIAKNNILQRAWGGAKDVYFVHSFAFRADDENDVAAYCTYGEDRFAAAVCKDNILGVQFHPEKSQSLGLALLTEWLRV